MSASFGQSVSPQNAVVVSQPTFAARQLTSVAWNTPDGLPYKQVPGVNLGATSFQVMDTNSIVFLSNASNEIITIDSKSGKVISKFSVCTDPRDFVYEGGKFYVLTDFSLYIYDASGNLGKTIEYSNHYSGVMRITRYNNSSYLLLPNGNSLQVEKGGVAVNTIELEGSITSTGNRVVTKISGEYSYSVTHIAEDGKWSESNFTSDKKVAGVFVVGSTADRIVLDVQTYLSESPISVERKFLSIGLKAGTLQKQAAEIKVPNVYYVWSNKEFYLTASGTLYNMVTAPEGAFVFVLTENGKAAYPEFIAAKSYHFNDHLIQIEEK